ncbi:MAG: hypothetical protein KGI27_09125 [Thaumarchaeota archaeon]|nr:hypothetical protein [Nitrososphaerota archaeon]
MIRLLDGFYGIQLSSEDLHARKELGYTVIVLEILQTTEELPSPFL